jgi:hypothetical protein
MGGESGIGEQLKSKNLIFPDLKVVRRYRKRETRLLN